MSILKNAGDLRRDIAIKYICVVVMYCFYQLHGISRPSLIVVPNQVDKAVYYFQISACNNISFPTTLKYFKMDVASFGFEVSVY